MGSETRARSSDPDHHINEVAVVGPPGLEYQRVGQTFVSATAQQGGNNIPA
jgi:hypothetical protein